MDLMWRRWMMQTTFTTQQQTTHTLATRWVKMRARAWAGFLCAPWHWQPAVTTVQHGQPVHFHGIPPLSTHTFSMLVESDVLTGRHSVIP